MNMPITKHTAPTSGIGPLVRNEFSVFATTSCPWLISFSLDPMTPHAKLLFYGITGIVVFALCAFIFIGGLTLH
jgi:hypothetical protein